eukprot:UN33724
MRSLVNHCIDLKFRKPTAQQCWPRIYEICRNEGIKLDENSLKKMCDGGNSDIRQIINTLQLWTRDGQKNMSYTNVTKNMKGSAKDLTRGPWDIIGKMFYPPHGTTIRDHIDMYFVDRSLLPLMVEHNFVKVRNCGLDQLAEATEAFSDADLMSNFMMKNQDWSFLPKHAISSCARPINKLLPGRVGGARFDFPIFFGKLSKTNRLKAELSMNYHHINSKHSASKMSYRLEFMPLIVEKLTTLLSTGDEDNIMKVVEMMKYYGMNTDDFNIMKELEDKFQKLAKCKAATTKQFNKLSKEMLEDHTKPDDFKPPNQKN